MSLTPQPPAIAHLKTHGLEGLFVTCAMRRASIRCPSRSRRSSSMTTCAIPVVDCAMPALRVHAMRRQDGERHAGLAEALRRVAWGGKRAVLPEWRAGLESQGDRPRSLDLTGRRARIGVETDEAAMIVRLLAASVILGALSSAALAADLPNIKGAPPVYTPPPAFYWNGAYVGIEGGGAWGSAEQTDSTPWSSGSYRVSGGLVGASIGYNWQVNNFVFGLEGDGSAAWISGSTFGIYPTYPACYLPNCAANLEALGTARGRVGIAFDRFLPYVTGGVAVGSLHGQEGYVAEGEGGSGTTTVPGWTIGAGIEAKLSPNWSAKLEYLHVDLGDYAIFDATIPPVGVFAQHIRFTSEIVRAGLNYKFDLFAPPAPVVARY